MKQLSRCSLASFNSYALLGLAVFFLSPAHRTQAVDVTPETASLASTGPTTFQSVAHGLDRFVAVGGNRSKTSADGVNWTETLLFPDWTGDAPHQARVTFGADRFVAVTDAGAVGHSEDGLTWELTVTEGPALYGVTFIDNQFFAYGVGGVRYRSSDGKEWTEVAAQEIALQALTYIAGTYVGSAVLVPRFDGDYQQPGGIVHVSTDLTSWQQKSDSWNVRRLAAGNGRVVAASFDGVIYSTDDLVSWEIYDSPMATMIRDIIFHQDRFLAVGHGFGGDLGTAVLLESIDGINWTEEALGEVNVFFSLAATNEKLVLAGIDDGILSLDRASGQILERLGPAPSTLHAAIVENGTLYAFGEGGLIKKQSDDGDWFRLYSPTSSRLRDAAISGGVMVAVGDGGTILSSSDGHEWTAANLDGSFTGTFGAVRYAHDRFVAVGEGGTIARSFDGASWALFSTGGGEQLWGVTAVPGGFLAAGEENPEESSVAPHGVILFSADGESWERRTIGEAPALYGVTHAAPGFVAVGAPSLASPLGAERGVILFSDDGFQWEVQESGVPFRLKQVRFSRGRYVAVGELGKVITSLDGKTWRAKDLGSKETLVGLSEIGERSLLAGEAGTLIKKYFGPWILQGPLGATVDAGDDHTFQVEAEGIGELLYEWYHDEDLIWSSSAPALNLADIDRSLAGVYTVVVTDDEGTETTLPAPLSVRLTLEHWLRRAGLIDEETDPETIAELAFQPGSDGVPPFLRYALSADEGESLKQLEILEGAPGESFLTLTFTRLKPPHDVRYEVQAGNGLDSWLPLEAPETQILDTNTQSETIRVFDSQPLSERGTRAFLRIQISRQ